MYAAVGKMARMYPMMLAMGLAIVVISFFIGLENSNDAARYFATDKVTRETTMTDLRASIASTDVWLPTLKFLGIGMILGGIVMALRVILDSLRAVGKDVLPREEHHRLPNPPWYGLLMPFVMMAGMAVFITALIIGIVASGTASDVYSNPAPVIDAAGPGSALLGDLRSVHQIEAWLTSLKFVAIASQFLAIAMGLAAILYTLKRQTEIIDEVLHEKIGAERFDRREFVVDGAVPVDSISSFGKVS